MVESEAVKGDLYAGHFGNTGLCRIKVLPEFGLNFPTCRVMAGHAAHLLICAVRVLGEQVRRKHQQEKENNRPVQNDYFNVIFKIRLRQAIFASKRRNIGRKSIFPQKRATLAKSKAVLASERRNICSIFMQQFIRRAEPLHHFLALLAQVRFVCRFCQCYASTRRF